MSKKKSGQNEFLKWFGPVLEALKNLEGSARQKEVAQWIGVHYQIPDNVLNARYEKSGQLKFLNQIAWARQYLVWEDLLESPKPGSKHGIWTLTKKGWNTTLNEEDAKGIFLKWVKIFQELRDNNKTVDKERKNVVKAEPPLEIEENDTKLKPPTLIEVLQSVSATGFEYLCGRLLKEYNFEDIEITQRSHDGGIDGYATLKLNPFVSLSVFFQCKRYQSTVPTEKVQAFIGVMETNKRSVEKGFIITTGSFAKSAYEIEKDNVKLELIDGEKLVEMFENVKLGVTEKIVYEPDMTFFEQYREKK